MLILADSGTASGTNMTADQDIFGIGKGTQATHADLFTVDEDGDVQISSGYLHVGTGSTPGTTPGVDDVFIEGTLEVDGACDFDGAVDIAGALTGMTSVTVNASATPTITLDDSDTTVETSDAVIYAQATDPVTDQEDVDVFIQTQINSTLTDVIDIDADGDLELGTATMDTMVNGDLTVTGGDITNGTVTIAAGAASGFTSLAIDNNASPQIVLDDSTHANVDGSIVVASVDANDANLVLNTKVATALVPFITIDGVLEEVLLGKKLDIASLGIENVGNIADDGAITLISSGSTVTVEDVVFTGGVISSVTSVDALDSAAELLAIMDDTALDFGTGVLTTAGFTTDGTITDGAFSVASGAVSGVTSIATISGVVTLQDAELEVPNGAADKALATAGEMHLNTTDEQLSFHSAADGEISGEAALSLIQHIAVTFDPTWAFDQTTNDVVPLFMVGDDMPEGFTITEWNIFYSDGDPTTELLADLICDSTPDYVRATGGVVMDALDTAAGVATADTGFDSPTCANGSRVYIDITDDPVDDNVLVTFDLWYYIEED
jgi:hypothetical protein